MSKISAVYSARLRAEGSEVNEGRGGVVVAYRGQSFGNSCCCIMCNCLAFGVCIRGIVVEV